MDSKKINVSVIIAAAGMGKRMNLGINKQFVMIKNKPVLAHTIEKFENCSLVDNIVLVLKEDEIDYCIENIIKKYNYKKIKKIVKGGKERQNSVYNGLKSLHKTCDIVLIHDGARPFIKEKTIIESIKCVEDNRACVVGVPVKDTIKIVNDKNEVVDTPNRSVLWAVQTPQSFEYKLILDAYDNASRKNIVGTDDSMLVELMGINVKMIFGDYTNIKITTKEDIEFSENIINNL